MRYYFHTTDGEDVRDREGEEFADDAAARQEAVLLFAELLRDRPKIFWIEGRFRVTVVDAEGRHVGDVTATGSQGDGFTMH